ncbi:MAG: hypothetical protein IPK81_04820 [Rhodospirillales bacterium]|nr:MAG: hypothetical protein IPK81_04820 [Rhodospirillales bacterium]
MTSSSVSGAMFARRRTMVALITLAAISAIAPVLFIVWWLLFDVEGTPRGSLIWRFALPSHLKALPVAESCAPPLYFYRGASGPRPQTAIMRFGTRLGPEALRAAYASLTAGCRADEAAAGSPGRGWHCVGRPYAEIEIRVAGGETCRRAEIRLVGP